MFTMDLDMKLKELITLKFIYTQKYSEFTNFY